MPRTSRCCCLLLALVAETRSQSSSCSSGSLGANHELLMEQPAEELEMSRLQLLQLHIGFLGPDDQDPNIIRPKAKKKLPGPVAYEPYRPRLPLDSTSSAMSRRSSQNNQGGPTGHK
eukprot:Skav207959  [mRNA]  locus=scaffold108:560979:566155:+ [translate_table: standard]